MTLKTFTLGSIRVKMEPDWAPENVRNFLKLTQTRWFDGTAFHRVVKGFVAQGGSAATRASGPNHPADRWARPLKGEFRADVKHVRGIISMAHGDDPDSATTSFFLMLGEAPNLDGKFSAFGRVIAGMEVLDAIEKEELDGEAPKRRIEIIEARIDVEQRADGPRTSASCRPPSESRGAKSRRACRMGDLLVLNRYGSICT